MLRIDKSIVINAVDNASGACTDISNGILNINSFLWTYNHNSFTMPMNIYIPTNIRNYNFNNLYALKTRLDNLKNKIGGLTYDIHYITNIMFDDDEVNKALILRTLNPYDCSDTPNGALVCPVGNDYLINKGLSSDYSCPSWVNNRITNIGTSNDNNTEMWIRRGVSTGMGFIPFVDDIKDAQEAWTGVDLITGEKLAWWERALCGTLVVVSFGAAIFTLGASEAIPISSLDEVVRGVKYTDDAIEGIRNTNRVSEVGEGVIKYGDDLSGSQKQISDMWTGKSNIDGVNVYKNDNIIDIDLMDHKGRTNLERMEEGLSPIGPDGKSIELHHWDQTNGSDIYEIENSFHKTNTYDLHYNTGSSSSLIDRPGFDKFRKEYWQNRAADFYSNVD